MKFKNPASIVALIVLAQIISGCRNHPAYVYSGVDPQVRPQKSDPIVFELPDSPSIRERNMAVLIKDELSRSGFNLVDDYKVSKWTLSFAIDRQTYTIGSTSRGSAIGFQVFGLPVTTGGTDTKYLQQTDVTVYMHLLKTEDIGRGQAMAIWEGSVRSKDALIRNYPNSYIQNLVTKFGQNYEGSTKLSRSYQKSINATRKPSPE